MSINDFTFVSDGCCILKGFYEPCNGDCGNCKLYLEYKEDYKDVTY